MPWYRASVIQDYFADISEDMKCLLAPSVLIVLLIQLVTSTYGLQPSICNRTIGGRVDRSCVSCDSNCPPGSVQTYKSSGYVCRFYRRVGWVRVRVRGCILECQQPTTVSRECCRDFWGTDCRRKYRRSTLAY